MVLSLPHSNSLRLSRLTAPALAVGLLMGLAVAGSAQSFTFTTANTSSGSSQGAGTTSTITGTGSGAANLTFTNSPDFTSTFLNAPTNIVPFRIVPVFTAPAVNPAVGTVLTANFNDTFSLSVTINSGGGIGTATFTGLNFSGPLTATFLGVGQPNTINGYAFNDNVTFGPLAAFQQMGQLVRVGGTSFSVRLNSFTNPGNPNGNTPEGSIGGFVDVPEPGSLAMLVGMGASGASLLVRRRKQRATAPAS